MLLLIYLLLFDLLPLICAINLPLKGRHVPRSSHLDKRASGALKNSNDLRYFTDITLGGKPFEVMIDTGESGHFRYPISNTC